MAEKGKAVFDYSICMACCICMHSCAFGAITMTKIGIDKLKKAYPELEDPARCVGCGVCVKKCPVDAISMKISEE